MTINLPSLREWIEPFLALVTLLGIGWAMLHKASRFVDAVKANTEAVTKLRIEVAAGSKKVGELAAEVGTLKLLAAEREKDVNRMEGQMGMVRSDYAATVKELGVVSGNLAALWGTLQALFPEKIPKRLIDSRG